MKPMRAAIIGVGVAASVALHVGVFAGVSRIQPKRTHSATAVAVVNQKKKPKARSREEEEKKPDEPPKPPPEAKITVPKQAPAKAAPPPPPPADAPPPVAAAPANAAPATGNYASLGGLSFGNGPGGIAIAPPSPGGDGGAAAPPSSATPPTKPVEKSFGSNGIKPAGPASGGDDGCTEAEVKAKETAQLNAPYSDDARAAGVGGKVHVKVTIDAAGAVVDAKVTKGLGHGLDENAIATAKRWRFSPATRCGKAVASSRVISFVFELAE
jgi:protein TonB